MIRGDIPRFDTSNAKAEALGLRPLPDRADPILHLNRPEQLAPVGCWLLLDVNGKLVYGRRTSYVEKRNRQLEYELQDGTFINGRFPWTAP